MLIIHPLGRKASRGNWTREPGDRPDSLAGADIPEHCTGVVSQSAARASPSGENAMDWSSRRPLTRTCVRDEPSPGPTASHIRPRRVTRATGRPGRTPASRDALHAQEAPTAASGATVALAPARRPEGPSRQARPPRTAMPTVPVSSYRHGPARCSAASPARRPSQQMHSKNLLRQTGEIVL